MEGNSRGLTLSPADAARLTALLDDAVVENKRNAIHAKDDRIKRFYTEQATAYEDLRQRLMTASAPMNGNREAALERCENMLYNLCMIARARGDGARGWFYWSLYVGLTGSGANSLEALEPRR
jgi:hypothetical protein